MVFAEELSLTLDEAIAIALRDNRDVLLKAQDIEKAKAKISEAKAGLFPTLNFTTTRAVTRGYYQKDIDQTTTQTTLKQYLYKGGKTVNTIAQNKQKLTVSETLLDKTRIETVLSVKKAFYTIILTEEITRLNKKIMDNTKAHFDLSLARYKNGQASELDMVNIKESLTNVKEAYEMSLNQLEDSKLSLMNLLYISKEIDLKADGELAYAQEELAYDEAFLKAMAKRPEIRQYEAQVKADKRAVEIAKADARPSIYASWDYYSRSHTSLTFSPSRGWQDYNIIGVTFSWPIFDGWATKAKVDQALVDLKTTQLNKEKTANDIVLELKSSYLALKTAINRIAQTKADVELYSDTLIVTQDKYTAGIASELDLEDITLGYEVSLFNQKQATYDYIIAKASFEKSMGGT